jgi:hypothetical protein
MALFPDGNVLSGRLYGPVQRGMMWKRMCKAPPIIELRRSTVGGSQHPHVIRGLKTNY